MGLGFLREGEGLWALELAGKGRGVEEVGDGGDGAVEVFARFGAAFISMGGLIDSLF